MVLSQPDAKGERAYKLVINTMAFEDKQVRAIMFAPVEKPPNGREYAYTLWVTENHPFWVSGLGWTHAEALESGVQVETADGKLAWVVRNFPVYRTDKPHVGWVQRDEYSEEGYLQNALTGELLEDNVVCDWDIREGDDPYLQTRVYNFEVEDFHTYYVGMDGVWVHNTGGGDPA